MLRSISHLELLVLPLFFCVRICHTFLPTDPCLIFLDGGELSSESTADSLRLGPAGLALHYANTIIQIYGIVSSFSSFLEVISRFWCICLLLGSYYINFSNK
jgi:hypothetical protein